ncbi:MAG TPA: NAD(P)/FAD-dependent oxidoreductase [Candidatus Saccharimonadales bacterium]|nr:NAD(P)/FAD-dependent oxidoreductase [Candidatus Saccharimonadales bacterium]
MKIAIIGAGFTGLTAGLKLSSAGHEVTTFEKEDKVGGLAVGFKNPGWEWSLEKHYHHWFANDTYAISLIKEVGLGDDLFFKKPRTDIFLGGKIYPLNSAIDILNLKPLSFLSRVRLGSVSLFLKATPARTAVNFEKTTAKDWIKKYYGSEVWEKVWKPLLNGKFGPFAESVNMAWFWARIYKRTFSLGYLGGGYQRLSEKIAEKIKERGGVIKLGTSFDPKLVSKFDKVIVTTPLAVFAKMFPELPEDYKNKINQIPHLHAFNMLLITKEKFLPASYWLNISDSEFPFVGVVQHTNFVDSAHYGGQHLTWLVNYLPPDHPLLKMKKKEILKKFEPFLLKINPGFDLKKNIIDFEMFLGPFAQPVFPVNYSKIKPDFITPIENVYLANMDMVYPWDRGTNYAIEMGEKVAKIVTET